MVLLVIIHQKRSLRRKKKKQKQSRESQKLIGWVTIHSRQPPIHSKLRFIIVVRRECTNHLIFREKLKGKIERTTNTLIHDKGEFLHWTNQCLGAPSLTFRRCSTLETYTSICLAKFAGLACYILLLLSRYPRDVPPWTRKAGRHNIWVWERQGAGGQRLSSGVFFHGQGFVQVLVHGRLWACGLKIKQRKYELSTKCLSENKKENCSLLQNHKLWSDRFFSEESNFKAGVSR